MAIQTFNSVDGFSVGNSQIVVINGVANVSANSLTVASNANVTGNLTAIGNISANYYIGNGSQLTGLPSGGIEYVYQTSNYSVATNQGVLADTTGGAFTVTLPATPTTGDQCVVADAGGVFGTNNLTVARNGSTIAGIAQNLTLDIDGVSVQLIYDGTTWNVYSQVGGAGGTAGAYGNTQVSAYLASGTDTAGFTTTGNISSGFILGNISAATGLGNISTINLNGNGQTVLAGNGTFVAQSGGGGVTSIVAGTGITISPAGGTGAVTINNAANTYNNNDVQAFLNGTSGTAFEGPLVVTGNTPYIAGALSSNPLIIYNYAVIVVDDGDNAGTLDVEPSEGSIQRYRLTGNITINGFVTAVPGTNVTLILQQDATGGRTLTSTMKFSGGTKTLSTAANAIDVLTVFYDGVNYMATLTKGYV